jgi:hypothetical protein
MGLPAVGDEAALKKQRKKEKKLKKLKEQQEAAGSDASDLPVVDGVTAGGEGKGKDKKDKKDQKKQKADNDTAVVEQVGGKRKSAQEDAGERGAAAAARRAPGLAWPGLCAAAARFSPIQACGRVPAQLARHPAQPASADRAPAPIRAADS